MAEKYLTYTGLKTYDEQIKKWTMNKIEGIDASGAIPGYFYEGHFYEDEEHTIEIEGKDNSLYVDLGDNNKLYLYENGEFVVVSDSGSDVSLGEVTVACGGIAKGTDLTGMSLQEIMEAMLSPYVAPSNLVMSFTKDKSGTLEHGDFCTITNIRVSWTAGSQAVTKVNLSGDAGVMEADVPSGQNYVDFSTSVAVSDSAPTRSFTASLTIPEKASVSRTQTSTTTFVYPIYYGMSQYDASSEDLDVQTLTKVVSSGTQTLSYTGSDSYPIIASISRLTKVTDEQKVNDYTAAFIGSETQVTLSSDDPAWGPQTYYVYSGSQATLDGFKFVFTF